MITEELKPKLSPQTCPFCGEAQDIIFNGHVPTNNPEFPTEVKFDRERGYSFCNCRNIFYTSWENMKPCVYDQDYSEKYNNETVRGLMLNYARSYFSKVKELCTGRMFLEIGAITPFLLRESRRYGFYPMGFDIIPHLFEGVPCISGNFEDYPFEGLKFDVIWASHIFEHFKDPISAAKKCFDLLNPSGVLFVAMPDPYFIDFKQPHLWGHWHLEEHHIMWDRDSFCEMMEEIGFKTVLKHRNVGGKFICTGDYHLIFQKP